MHCGVGCRGRTAFPRRLCRAEFGYLGDAPAGARVMGPILDRAPMCRCGSWVFVALWWPHLAARIFGLPVCLCLAFRGQTRLEDAVAIYRRDFSKTIPPSGKTAFPWLAANVFAADTGMKRELPAHIYAASGFVRFCAPQATRQVGRVRRP